RVCTPVRRARQVRGLQAGTLSAVDVFDFTGSIRALLAVAIAAVPAVLAYVRGRQIARLADDPALPERLFAGRRTSGSSIVFTITALITLTGGASIWAIPVA